MIGTHSDITEQVRHQEAVEHSATHDSLTGLPNRFLFSELIQKALHRGRRNHRLLALLYIDLDGFKEVNDHFGHDAGDALLITVAQRMQRRLRREDVIARLGGDEFVITVSDLAEDGDVIPLLERLLGDIKQKIITSHGQEMQISASIGVTFYPQAEQLGPEALLRQADHAMYAAKAAGKNQYRFFDVDASSSLRNHQRRMVELQRAIESDELELHYQPKVDMAGTRVVGFEALLRWRHPEKGLLSPDSFLPDMSTERELMLALGRWVMETAFRRLSELRHVGYDVSMAINVSSHELRSPDTCRLLDSLLERYPDIPGDRVELELLEVSALEDIEGARKVIRTWQERGIRVALDDFGTGYSTLGYLKSLPVDTLKIDKSFVIDMLHDSGSLSILKAAIGLARAFRCDVVAEGVESVEHGALLLQLGCNLGQGYAIARPMPASQMQPWLEAYEGDPRWRTVGAPHAEPA
jgi:diguanylate cyclase (GGDEF)-like protein